MFSEIMVERVKFVKLIYIYDLIFSKISLSLIHIVWLRRLVAGAKFKVWNFALTLAGSCQANPFWPSQWQIYKHC